MSYTNKTQFYEIPLPIESDLYNPMDYNESMEAVDTALHTAAIDSDAAVDTANAASTAASEAVSGLEALSSTVNEEKGKLTALTARVTAAENEIDDVRGDLSDAICSFNEPTATSTHAYSIGEYFWYNNTLYIATSNISIGDTIVPNTNCNTITVCTELAQTYTITCEVSQYSAIDTGFISGDYTIISIRCIDAGSVIVLPIGSAATANLYCRVCTISSAGVIAPITEGTVLHLEVVVKPK